MLTRIEIDGFKTFRDFELDVPPFLVVLGRNAAGKSNLFDALLFLGRLADEPLLEAARHTRGDLADLFHRRVDGSRTDRMTFAVEVLLEPTATDAFGDTERIVQSRLRYELAIELRATPRGSRPFVAHEAVRLIRKSDDQWIRRFDGPLRTMVASYSSRPPDLLLTDTSNAERPTCRLFQQGRAGRTRELPANEATATVLSSLTTVNEFPLLFALKQELRSWRLLHLDPTALREPDSFEDPDILADNGAHLPNSLHRIMQETATADRPVGVLSGLAADLTAVVPEVVDLRLTEDPVRRLRQVEVLARGEAPCPARAASDGTLRAVALLAALHDPHGAGLICIEEPENGIFPERLAQIVHYLSDRVFRALERRRHDEFARLSQVILGSHSPSIFRAIRAVDDAETTIGVVFADKVSRSGRGESRSRVSRVRPVRTTSQPPVELEVGAVVSPAEIAEFAVTDDLHGHFCGFPMVAPSSP